MRGTKVAAERGMGNPGLDQFMQGIWLKVVPVAIVCGIAGIFLGEIRRWLERRFSGKGRFNAATRLPAFKSSGAASRAPASNCTKCGGNMVERTAKRGARAGSKFWGCSNYPRCRETVDA